MNTTPSQWVGMDCINSPDDCTGKVAANCGECGAPVCQFCIDTDKCSICEGLAEMEPWACGACDAVIDIESDTINECPCGVLVCGKCPGHACPPYQTDMFEVAEYPF